MTISPTQHSDFSSFLAVISTDKPVNVSKHAALSCSWTFLRLENTWKEFEQIGLQNKKNMRRENVLAHAHLNFCLKDLLTKSNRTTSQSYKVEERTFETPCTIVNSVWCPFNRGF